MPRNVIGAPPYKLDTLDIDRPITPDDLSQLLNVASGVSICIRSVNGHPRRGGYFFHIKKADDNYCVFDFQKKKICVLNLDHLIRFINHVSGRKFDDEMLNFCQSFINFKQDQKGHD